MIIFGVNGCCDNVSFTREDLEKHSWLKVFTPRLLDLEGVHNIDNDYLRLGFRTEFGPVEYFSNIDRSAVEQGWKLVYSLGQDRVFTRDMQGDLAVVKIHYSESGWISLKFP